MPNRVTKGKALVGSLRGPRGGLGQFALVATVARTDTAAKALGTLPKDAQVTGLTVWGAAASNAGTSANVSVGKAGGNGHEYLNALDVKTAATGAGQVTPNGGLLFAPTVAASDITVTATYAETGTASTSGGPWTIILEYVV